MESWASSKLQVALYYKSDQRERRSLKSEWEFQFGNFQKFCLSNKTTKPTSEKKHCLLWNAQCSNYMYCTRSTFIHNNFFFLNKCCEYIEQTFDIQYILCSYSKFFFLVFFILWGGAISVLIWHVNRNIHSIRFFSSHWTREGKKNQQTKHE